jgi:mannosidase alpha-like ER degradation enhancer 1
LHKFSHNKLSVKNAFDFRYMGDLLTLAHDLGDRLLSSFSNPGGGATATRLPHPRVNLQSGVPREGGLTTTCTAGAGSLLLEMGG